MKIYWHLGDEEELTLETEPMEEKRFKGICKIVRFTVATIATLICVWLTGWRGMLFTASVIFMWMLYMGVTEQFKD